MMKIEDKLGKLGMKVGAKLDKLEIIPGKLELPHSIHYKLELPQSLSCTHSQVLKKQSQKENEWSLTG